MKDAEEKILEAIEYPDKIIAGSKNEFIAVKDFDGRRKIVVVYSEVSSNDGFVITAYLTSKIEKLEKLKLVWQR